MKKWLLGVLLAGSMPVSFCHSIYHMPERATAKSVKPLVHGDHSMVVTNNPWASKAAQMILAVKGNAVDAAIAAAFVLGVTEPQSSGLGGGGYALTYRVGQAQLYAYDGREYAPHSATADLFLDKQGHPLAFNDAALSAKAFAIPGEVRLLSLMHRKEGRLAWKKLLQPAIRIARQGYPMSPRLFKLLQNDQTTLVKDAAIKSIYFTPENHVKPVGSLVVNLPLAQTLEEIATNPDVFYRGAITDDMIDTINQLNEQPLVNRDDFKNYKVFRKLALCGSFRHYRLCTVPPSAGGLATLELLKLYAAHYFGQQVTDSLWAYTFLEASQLMFADRQQYLADPLFTKQPLEGLLSDEYIKTRSELITGTALTGDIAPGVPNGFSLVSGADPGIQRHGTTSLVIVDRQGRAVSLTLSIEQQFGNHHMVDGFFLNNHMTDFSFMPKDSKGRWIANRIAPFKRPRSAISPMMVFNQKLQLQIVTGSPGGSVILCYVAKNLIQMLDFNWDPARSAASGNLCAFNGQVLIEADSDLLPLVASLKKRGEVVTLSSNLTSGETNIKRDPLGGWLGAADPRREGLAIGG